MSDKDIDTLLEEAANLTDEDILAYRKQAGVIPEEGASTLRKVKYGWDQSSWILGDAARLAESYLTGVSSEELDKKRRQKLEREYRDLTPEDKNSFAAGTGEFLGETIDPFYAIPYFGQVGAVAKKARFTEKALGSIKSGTAVGSLVAADTAIDSMARGKEISTTDMGVAAALGFTGGAIFRPTAKTSRADTIDVLGQQKTLPKIIEDVVTAEDEAVIQQVLKSVDAEDSTLALALRDIPNVGKQISEANKSKKAYKKARKKLKKKYKYTDKKDPALLAKIPKELVEGNEEANRFLKNLPSLYQKYSEDLATSTFGTIERLAKENTFNRNIFARAITRPLIGGVGGYGVGATMGMFTEDDTMSPWGWALIGMTGGLLSKKIIKSDLSLNVKEEGLKGIEDLARRSIWAQANMIFAGGSAGKLNAYGGGVAMLNKRMFKQIQGGSGSSLEETVSRVTQQLVKTVDDKTIELGIEGAQGTQLREAGWKYANGFIDETELAKTFSPKQISQIQEYATFTRQFVDNYADNHVLAVGIDFRRMKEYGLPQMHNAEKILSNKDAAIRAYTQAYMKQKPSLSENEAKDAAEDFIENVLTTGNLSLREKNNFNITSSFDPRGDYVDHKLKFRPLTDHFERSREFVSLDARKEIQDFLIQDPDQILKLYLDKTVDKVEFARLFGAKGEGITNLKNQIHRETKEALKLATTEKQKTMLRSRHKNQIKAIHDTVDAFFGIYDARSTNAQNPMLNNMFGIMTTMANITYLPKAVVAATGDLIQPFQNSGVFNSIKGFSKGLSKEQDYSTTTGFASKDILGQELRQFIQTGNTVGASGGLTQTAIRKINERFFRMIGLASVTKHAGRFAYNAGIEDGFTIAQKLAKGKRSSGLLTQAKAYDLTDEAVNTLKNFKSVDEAMADPLGREFLDRIGNKAASRDRIIPEIGNRRFFTQSKDPIIRSLGQFLSWAQAKTTQLNALVTRIEDGDAALAVRMMGTLVLYDGVLTFRDFLNDPTGEKLADKDWHYESFGDKAKSFEQLVGRSAVFSGNFVPWQVDKVARIFSSGAYGDPLESISPTFSWIASMIEGAVNVSGQLAYGDTEGAAMQTIERLPLGKEALDLSAGIAGERVLKDQPNTFKKKSTVGLHPFAKGGRVSGVIRKKKFPGGTAEDPSMFRPDGTRKSKRGFLGPIINIRGEIMTEFSTDLGDEKGTLIPALVPTQTPEAREYMRHMEGGRGFNTKIPMEKQILETARAHARPRIEAGLSPFYQDGEEKVKVKKDKGGIALVPNAPAEPDQRIDKMTGVPYDEQAGEAYTDVEDRQGLIAAVLGKKLQGQNSV